MSHWRRNAIEELPCCKSIIEGAQSPTLLWLRLYDELTLAYDREPRDEITIQQIYAFALRYARSPHNTHLSCDVVAFFQGVFNNSGALGEDLGNRLSAPDFARFEPAFRYWFSEEKSAEVKKRFHTTLHGKRR